DPAEATRKGMTVEELAKATAANWRKGLADSDQPPERIARFRDSADIAIYTPGSTAGLSLTVLKSFTAPDEAVLNDSDALRDRVGGAVSGLLALLGISGDALRSREHILLSTILERAWKANRDVDMPTLIREIQTPPFTTIGVMDIESIFPASERFKLSMALNNLLASPGFSAWLEGEELDVARLLHTPAGKPRISILSIAHLNDAERMFFVTILLNEVLAWMRAQPGTSSLRAILYMDEVFGYFPPTADPPSKTPMLALLKQARAFGLGVVLATQNPVDLDYKGLSNAGTWLIGRLQTERDKLRVLDGLEGASTAAGSSFDRAQMDKVLSGLGNRVFLLNNVHDDAPVVFQSRFVLSYLRGPLTREQIAVLMAPRKWSAAMPGVGGAKAAPAAKKLDGTSGQRPVLPPEITEVFLHETDFRQEGELVYRPALLGSARMHFTQTRAGVDTWENLAVLKLIDDRNPTSWEQGEHWVGSEPGFDKKPANG
ncbi:MAG: ATP-binding protein, partial [Planctomycetaceae bacterium]